MTGRSETAPLIATVGLLFDTYLNSVGEECTALTEPDWIDRLGGVDVFTSSHSARAISYSDRPVGIMPDL